MAGDVGYGIGVGGAQVFNSQRPLQQTQAPQILAAKEARESASKEKKQTAREKRPRRLCLLGLGQ